MIISHVTLTFVFIGWLWLTVKVTITSKINTFNQVHGISDHKELVDFILLIQPIKNVNIFT